MKKLKALSRLRPVLSRLKFSLGLSPHLDRNQADPAMFIPEPYKAVCLISADFELAWAFRFSRSSSDPLKNAVERGSQTRKNVPGILRLCDEYNVPVTWATVGHLFLQSCRREDGLAHPDILRLGKFENAYWSFQGKDWFVDDPCTDYQRDPAWYCPDLIEDIISKPAGHEIGCHTFSHIDCRDSVCSREVFLSELNACAEAAEIYGLRLRSFVHPGHQLGHVADLAKLGYTSFRTDDGDTLAHPRLHKPGIWEFRNTACLDWREGWSSSYHVRRYKAIIHRAIKHRKTCVFWFHPSFSERFMDEVFAEVMEYLHLRGKEIVCLTHGAYADWLTDQNQLNSRTGNS